MDSAVYFCCVFPAGNGVGSIDMIHVASLGQLKRITVKL